MGQAERKSLVFGLAVAVIGCLVVQPTTAQESDLRAMHEDWMRDFQTDLALAGDVLRGKDSAEWTQEDIEAYLFNALHAIYNANNIYIDEHKQHPYDGKVLRNTGILSIWPGNPFNDWQPITWEAGYTGFVPGDVVVQLCPPDWYSGYVREIPLTYAMTINGPSEDYLPLGSESPYPIESIFDWDSVPRGTAYMTTSYYEPAWKTRPKIEEKLRILKELEE